MIVDNDTIDWMYFESQFKNSPNDNSYHRFVLMMKSYQM